MRYAGFDVSRPNDRRRARGHAGDCRAAGSPTDRGRRSTPADYAVASGIFNVKLDTPARRVAGSTCSDDLDDLAALSGRGLRVQRADRVLGSPTERRADLYYADPLELLRSLQAHDSRASSRCSTTTRSTSSRCWCGCRVSDMARLVIFGAGDIARLAHFYFTRDSPHEVVAFTVDPRVPDGRHASRPAAAWTPTRSRAHSRRRASRCSSRSATRR